MDNQANELLGPHPGRVSAPPKKAFDGLERQGRDSGAIPQELHKVFHARFEVSLELALAGHTTEHFANEFAFEFVDKGLQFGVQDPAPCAIQETSAANLVEFPKTLNKGHPTCLHICLHAAPAGPGTGHAVTDTCRVRPPVVKSGAEHNKFVRDLKGDVTENRRKKPRA
jgi:hypothetical protein